MSVPADAQAATAAVRKRGLRQHPTEQTVRRPHRTPGEVSEATAASAARRAAPGPRICSSSLRAQPAATLRSAAGVCGVAWAATRARVLPLIAPGRQPRASRAGGLLRHACQISCQGFPEHCQGGAAGECWRRLLAERKRESVKAPRHNSSTLLSTIHTQVSVHTSTSRGMGQVHLAARSGWRSRPSASVVSARRHVAAITCCGDGTTRSRAR